MKSSRNLVLIYVAAFLRSTSIGLLGVVLAVYLARIGFSTTAIGIVIAAGLAGNAAATAIASWYAERLGRRRLLFWVAVLSSLGGVGLASLRSPAGLIPLAFFAMLNGMGTDRSAGFAVEQAMIPGLVADRSRTWALSWYNVVLDGAGALGALASALPILIHTWSSLSIITAYRWIFLAYAAVNLASAGIYSFLDPQVEATGTAAPGGTVDPISPVAKSVVRRLAALFALDAGGGGFLADAFLAYWFFHRFGVNESGLALLFFAVRALNALSHLGAAWLARRIGLVRTMVFTHLPSSLFLLAVPLVPTFKLAALLLLLREALVEMDVPTRQSYVAAVVEPRERVYASGITNLTRTGAWAATSSVAGALMQHMALSAPLVLGGTMKVVYDLLLYRSFRHVKPPEERPERNAELRTQLSSNVSLPFTKGSSL